MNSSSLVTKGCRLIFMAVVAVFITACGLPKIPSATLHPSQTTNPTEYKYLIGPGDTLSIFVWRNPEVSGQFNVRPDGMITTSLVEDIVAAGKTPTALARDIEQKLSVYLRDPVVSVIVEGFNGPFSEQIRVIGEAASPQAVNYSQNMTILDVMIRVGGLTEFADGNAAVLVRIENGQQIQYQLSLDDLIRDGDIAANADVLPGDIVVIPEAWF